MKAGGQALVKVVQVLLKYFVKAGGRAGGTGLGLLRQLGGLLLCGGRVARAGHLQEWEGTISKKRVPPLFPKCATTFSENIHKIYQHFLQSSNCKFGALAAVAVHRVLRGKTASQRQRGGLA